MIESLSHAPIIRTDQISATVSHTKPGVGSSPILFKCFHAQLNIGQRLSCTAYFQTNTHPHHRQPSSVRIFSIQTRCGSQKDSRLTLLSGSASAYISRNKHHSTHVVGPTSAHSQTEPRPPLGDLRAKRFLGRNSPLIPCLLEMARNPARVAVHLGAERGS